MAILITGSAGFIGSHLAETLAKSGEKIIGIDDLNDYYNPAQKEANVQRVHAAGDCTLYREDIRTEGIFDTLFARHPDITTVVHLAARAGVRASLERPELYASTNVQALVQLLESMRRANKTRLVFASSSSVYGEAATVPFSEGEPVDKPISPYAATKRAGELLCYAQHHLYGLSVACLRFFTVYGPWGRQDMAPYRFVDLIEQGKPIQRYGDGSSSRDYTFIADIVQGIQGAINFVQSGKHYEIVNLGNESPVTLNTFIELLGSVTGKDVQIEQQSTQPGDVSRTYADISKAKALLGYRPTTSLEDGLRQLVAWYRETKKEASVN